MLKHCQYGYNLHFPILNSKWIRKFSNWKLDGPTIDSYEEFQYNILRMGNLIASDWLKCKSRYWFSLISSGCRIPSNFSETPSQSLAQERKGYYFIFAKTVLCFHSWNWRGKISIFRIWSSKLILKFSFQINSFGFTKIHPETIYSITNGKQPIMTQSEIEIVLLLEHELVSHVRADFYPKFEWIENIYKYRLWR